MDPMIQLQDVLRRQTKYYLGPNLARKRIGGQPSFQFYATTPSTLIMCGLVKGAHVKVHLIRSVFSPAHLTNAPSGSRNGSPSNRNGIAFTQLWRKTTRALSGNHRNSSTIRAKAICRQSSTAAPAKLTQQIRSWKTLRKTPLPIMWKEQNI